MIVGFGLDIVDIERIAKTLERFGDRFLDRAYTAGEREYCMKHRRPESSLAARFGAKEAYIKAVGTRRGVRWRDVEVVREGGPPSVKLHGMAKKLAEERGVDGIHLTLAHDAGVAVAAIILENTGD